MSIVLQLKTRAVVPAIQRLVSEFGATLRPMHPGIQDDYLATFYDVEAPSDRTSRLVEVLLGREGVAAAYVKPRDEMPD